MVKLSKFDEFAKKLQIGIEIELLRVAESVAEDYICSNEFIGVIEELIKEGEFDDAVHDRFTSDDEMIDGFCGDCDRKCNENFKCDR